MLIKLVLILIGISALEIYLLLQVHLLIGLAPTVALILLTGISGAYLLRVQGTEVLHRLKGELNAGRLPGKEILDGVLILIGGAFLLAPGFFTDLIGFLLLVPWTRAGVRRLLLPSFGRWKTCSIRTHLPPK